MFDWMFNPKPREGLSYSHALQVTNLCKCENCQAPFNEHKAIPFIAYPCQHYYCGHCVHSVILKGKNSGTCPAHHLNIKKTGIKKSQLLLEVARLIQHVQNVQNVQPHNAGKLKLTSKKIIFLTKLKKIFGFCHKCEKAFDQNNRPIQTYQSENFVCVDCLEKYRECPSCGFHTVEKSTPNSLAIDICAFFRRLGQTQQITVRCKKGEFKLNVQQGSTILEIFEFLRNRKSIPLNEKEDQYTFYISNVDKGKNERKEVKYTEKIRPETNMIDFQYAGFNRTDKIKNVKLQPIVNVHFKASEKQRKEVLPRFLATYQIKPETKQLLYQEIERTINQPFTKEELKVSQNMDTSFREQIKKNQNAAAPKIMLAIKQSLKDQNLKVIFTPKSTNRSKLSFISLTSEYFCDRVIIKQTQKDSVIWSYETVTSSEQNLQKYLAFKKAQYAKKFKISEQSLVFHSVVKGPMAIMMSTNQCKALADNITPDDKNIQIHPYFTQMELSPEDFDEKGNITFPDSKNSVEYRGNWPYYQPIKCTRYGLKVSGCFDGGNDRWLQMKNQYGEYAVAFHGVKNPNHTYKQYKNKIVSIVSGLKRDDKKMLILGPNQGYEHYNCVSKPGQKVGKGIYLSPFLKQALGYTNELKIGNESYHLVFQCRLKPSSIRIPQQKQNYWIIPQSESVRPYGIILIKSLVVKSYPSPLQQFKQDFSYEKYKAQIKKNNA